MVIGILCFFSAYMASRFIMTGAVKKLDDSNKLKLLNIYSNRGNYLAIMIVVLVLAFVGIVQLFPESIVWAAIVYLTSMLGLILIRFVVNYDTLKTKGLPTSYLNSFITSFVFVLFGLLALFIGVSVDWIG